MNLERISAGQYSVHNAGKLVRIEKTLDNKWDVVPEANVEASRQTVDTYAKAKMVAQWLVRRNEADKVESVAKGRGKHGVDMDALRLELSERLRRMADEVLA